MTIAGQARHARKRRIAVVVQRYGEEVNGGAELAARFLANKLAAIAEIHIITTCAVDYITWADSYPAGTTFAGNVQIHRFSVDKERDWRSAQRQTGKLLTGHYSAVDAVQWIYDQGPYSTPLFDYIEENRARFDFFVFFTYVYATTFFGLALVPEKAILVPTAHEEPFISLPLFRSLFHLPQALVYLTEPEKNLVNRMTHNSQKKHIVCGIGIEVPRSTSSLRFRRKYQIDGDFLFYGGRIDESKNVPELIDHFLLFRQQHEMPLKLVLTGRSHLDLPSHPDIVHLGFVPEQDKFDALNAATLVVVPSLFESLSILTLEAWALATPVLANGRCEVLKYQCRRSNGGLYYTSYDEFRIALKQLLDSSELRRSLGHNGRGFVEANYKWKDVVDSYRSVFDSLSGAGAKLD